MLLVPEYSPLFPARPVCPAAVTVVEQQQQGLLTGTSRERVQMALLTNADSHRAEYQQQHPVLG